MSVRQLRLFCSTMLLLSATGCGGSDIPPGISGSTEEATVKGKVLVNGKPVKGGDLTFRVANVNRPGIPNRTAKINPDGTYEVTTLVGQNYVEISGVKELKTPKLRQYLDDDTSINVSSGGSPSMDLNYPPIPRSAPQ